MIKFVYFDLGGVAILDFGGHPEKWNKMKQAMGVTEDSDKKFSDLYTKYERKDLCLTRSVDSLIPIFTKKNGIHFPPNFSILDYLVDHFEVNRSIWPAIDKAQKNCRVGLLTNMYVGMFAKIEKRKLLPPTKWDVTIDSVKVGLQKPDPKIYELAEKLSGVGHREILFIDNTRENIDTAEKFGWQTYFYDPANPEVSSKKLMDFIKEKISR